LYARAIADAIIDGRNNATKDLAAAVGAEGNDEFVEVDGEA
jgi:small subunit ribosomal protein S2